MMGSLKKPRLMTIQIHVSCCETMSGYIAHLPTLQDSPLVVASTKKGNISFNNTTLANIVLATCPTEWRNLYKMNHKTVPELTRSMLFDLKNIEKVFAEKNSKKARSNKAAAGTAPKTGENVPRKHGNGGGSGGPAPKKAHSVNNCKWCKAAGGPFNAHDTCECCRFNKDGKEIGKPHKLFNSAKNLWKKGSGDLSQMAYLTKKLEKLEKKLKKSKKAAKKRTRDSLNSDSNSDLDSGPGSTNGHLDKRFKLDKPSGINLESTDTHPFNATRTA
jgi:hypothetical protein